MRLKVSASLSVESGPASEADQESRLERWLARACEGDAGAFDSLLEHYQGLCYHVALRKLGDPELAMESCQEAALSAWRRLDTFSGGPAGFRSWLVRIVVNSCIDRLRYESRRPTPLPIDVGPESDARPEPLTSTGPSVEDIADNSDVRARLRWAVKRVPEPYRTTLMLHLCEFTYAEISATQGVDIGTVSSRLARARGHLRALLTGAVDVSGSGRDDSPPGRLPIRAERAPGESAADDRRGGELG